MLMQACRGAAGRRRRGGAAGVARGARAHRRRAARDRVTTDDDSVHLHRAQPRGAQADDGAHRRRHGARRLRVRDGADARGRAREDAGRDRAGRQRRRDPPRRRRPRCRAASTARQAGDRREPARHRDRARTASKLISKEPVVLINLPKRGSDKPSNVVIRGVTPAGLTLRPQVRLVEGRMFRPGTSEIIVGRAIAHGFRGAGVGETLRFASRDWTVVGMFDAGRTGFDSEIWGDAEQMLQAFRRLGFSVADLPARRHRALRRGQEGARIRSAAHARGEARDALLRRPVGGAVEVHQLPRHDDLDHLLDRRDHRRDDHDVRERRVAHRRRSARCARSGSRARRSSSRSWSRRCCSGSWAGSSGSSPRRSCRRSRSRR